MLRGGSIDRLGGGQEPHGEFEEKSLFMPFSRYVVALMVNEGQVQPFFMVAALIFWKEAQSVLRNGECTVLMYFPSFIRVRRLEKPANVSPFTWYSSWFPQWWDTRWH